MIDLKDLHFVSSLDPFYSVVKGCRRLCEPKTKTSETRRMNGVEGRKTTELNLTEKKVYTFLNNNLHLSQNFLN